MIAPSTSPTRTVMIQVYGSLSPIPRVCGIQVIWAMAIVYPMNPSIDPTERSMLRDTMTSTMPVAMMPIEALCTDRFHRLRGVRKSPPEMTLKPIQMIARAAISPNRRVSTSAERRTGVTRPRTPGAGADAPSMEPRGGTDAASDIVSVHWRPRVKESALRHLSAAQSADRQVSFWPSGADFDGACLDALAELFLCDPVGIEHDVQVVLRDRDRLEVDGDQRVATRALERLGPFQRGDVRVLAQGGCGLAGRSTQFSSILPDVDRLRAEGDAVQGGDVAVLAGDRDLPGQALGLEG